MRHLIDATRQAVGQENWYAALSLALTMPDICGLIAFPALKGKSKQRVVDWFDKYLAEQYRAGFMRSIQSMAGGDFYALRCAYLHQGEFQVGEQSARDILNRFHLTAPGPGSMHNNLSGEMDAQGKITNAVLQLSVDKFCEEICVAVEAWLADVDGDARIQDEIDGLGKLARINQPW